MTFSCFLGNYRISHCGPRGTKGMIFIDKRRYEVLDIAFNDEHFSIFHGTKRLITSSFAGAKIEEHGNFTIMYRWPISVKMINDDKIVISMSRDISSGEITILYTTDPPGRYRRRALRGNKNVNQGDIARGTNSNPTTDSKKDSKALSPPANMRRTLPHLTEEAALAELQRHTDEDISKFLSINTELRARQNTSHPGAYKAYCKLCQQHIASDILWLEQHLRSHNFDLHLSRKK